MKVLIVKLSALGDVVHALPVLAHVKAVHPDAEVDWLVDESFASILDGHPLISRVVPAGLKRWRREGLGSLRRGLKGLARTLRAAGYDVILDLQGNIKSGLLTWLTRAPARYGFARDGVREWPNLLATTQRVPLADAHHISERSLAIARSAFPGQAEVPLAGPLHVNEEVASKVRAQLQQAEIQGPLVVCHYGTTWTTKLWPVESWRSLLSHLAELDCRVLLTWGDEQERTVVDDLNRCVPQAMVWPRGSLLELVALLAEATLVVGGDTGPVHIAAAVGTSTVSWYRVTDATRNGPRGGEHTRLQAPMECSPCLLKDCERDAECATSISVEHVYNAVRSCLSGGPHDS